MADFFTQLLRRTSDGSLTPRPVIRPLFAPGPLLAGTNPDDSARAEEVSGKHSALPAEKQHEATSERSLPPAPLSIPPEQVRPLRMPGLQNETEAGQWRKTGGDARNVRFTPETHSLPVEQPLLTEQPPPRSSIMSRFAIEPSFPSLERRPPSLPDVPSPASPQRIGRDGHPERESSAPAVPVVTVSIGRIDVRAVMPQPPAPARKAASATPKPSLQAYLEARDREKR